MTTFEALQVLKPETDTVEGLKTAYRAAARKYHPDINPHGETVMKLVNVAYELLLSKIGEWVVQHDPENESSGYMSLDEEIAEILNQVSHLVGLHFEVCGTWLWITGNTYAHRKELKEAGLFFAPKKQAWFWRPPESKARSRGQWDMEKIRTVHGSLSVHPTQRQGLTI